jgi:hypothetical protein
MRRPCRLIGVGATVVVVAATGLLAGGVFAGRRSPAETRQHSNSRLAFGSFAGYVWSGHVRSAHASWLVPVILGGSSNGYASTWIGALGHGAPATFIQIGTTEAREPASAAEKAHNVYYAFWSDTKRGFRAKKLFPVRPGNEISATLLLRGRRWTLAVNDATSGAVAYFSTPDATPRSYVAAEWMQEDVARIATRQPGPYPRLSAVHFGQVSVNDRTPSQTELNSAWMSANGETLAPTQLDGASFAVEQAPALSAAGQQYLNLDEALGRDEENFIVGLLRATTATRPSQMARISSRFITALRNFAGGLSSSRWPSSAQTQIDSLLREVRVIAVDTRLVGRGAPAERAATRSAWLRDAAGGPFTSLARSDAP